MAAVYLDPVAFRKQFPAFQCTPPIADSTLQVYFDTATLYINNPSGGAYCGGRNLSEAQRRQCLYLMTAHLTHISQMTQSGTTVGVITNATVDKVSVTLEPPPATNQWSYWLQSTPYGQQLYALLKIASAGGMYINPSPAITGFRRAGW